MDVTQAGNTSNFTFNDEYDEYCYEDNSSWYGNMSHDNATDMMFPNGGLKPVTIVLVISYAFICLFGLIGNGLVIYVVVRYAKMKTVTNLYIVNLAISDVLFLTSMPFLMTTSILQHWVFGTAMCKIYFVLVSINLFTGVFTLTALSADRYLAVCHPVRSSQYRTTTIAFFVCLCLWSVSFLVMLPIILYSTTIQNPGNPDHKTCTISWPDGQPIPPEKAFTWYTFLLGFAMPVSLISILYISVIVRLQHVGPAIKSKEKKRTHKRVTRMVLAVISVYILCWLPYWVFQAHLTFRTRNQLKQWQIHVFSFFTVLTFANSMLNPVLYAFLSDNFRRSFAKAFKCATGTDFDRSVYTKESSVFPKNKPWRNESGKNVKRNQGDKYEMATMITTTGNEDRKIPKSESQCSLNDGSNMYVDKESQTQQAAI